MFRRVKPKDNTVTIYIDDKPFSATAGEPVANILLNEGFNSVHTAPNGKTRGPYCMMGVCFECLVEIDGRSNQQACQTMLLNGMHVRRQVAPINDCTLVGKRNDG